MNAKHISASEIVIEQVNWGQLAWVSRPAATHSRNITEIIVTLEPGFGHNFHKHPQQEEVIYVLSGQVDQWLQTKKQTLFPGDATFVGKDVVHATFNTSKEPARFLVVLSPAIGEGGYEMVDVANEAPWIDLVK